ncbi:PD-(D/E)XK nuclease-like domain-containing protein [Nocardia sp. FDAARGOS_372]|uniref:PD-(D/E)XK nuclease-like domain-containing protein n=1 Tax=Nocardia sp. FDAARGOS_372 TaxID=2018066 RepID=UPI0020A48B88|nr:PD-(D/E)XK nuclease-like domain-containing protein [Nocardia sp. FDAARGOS_372]
MTRIPRSPACTPTSRTRCITPTATACRRRGAHDLVRQPERVSVRASGRQGRVRLWARRPPVRARQGLAHRGDRRAELADQAGEGASGRGPRGRARAAAGEGGRAGARDGEGRARARPRRRVLRRRRGRDVGWWVDEEFGVRLRIRVDWLTRLPDGRMVAVDYKTSRSSGAGALAKAMGDYGYFMQKPFYLAVLRALGFDIADFVFISQCKKPPYRLTVARIDPRDVELGTGSTGGPSSCSPSAWPRTAGPTTAT